MIICHTCGDSLMENRPGVDTREAPFWSLTRPDTQRTAEGVFDYTEALYFCSDDCVREHLSQEE